MRPPKGTVIVSDRERDRAPSSFMHAKQRQIAASLREDAAMFGQVIA
jgi:hypothetical protein